MSHTVAIALIAALDACVVLTLAYVCSISFLHDRRLGLGTPWILRVELGSPTECDEPREKAPDLLADLAL